MRLALVQMSNSGSMKENLAKSVKAIKNAKENKADIVLFPEVHLTEFFPLHEKRDATGYRLKIDSDEVKTLCNACKENNIMAIPNIYLEENGKAYDASILINTNGDISGIQKML